jgi:hypothetical protein
VQFQYKGEIIRCGDPIRTEVRSVLLPPALRTGYPYREIWVELRASAVMPGTPPENAL